MSHENIHENKSAIANAFGRTTDPLAQYEPTFHELDADPFELFIGEEVRPRGITEGSVQNYIAPIEEWQEYMADQQSRHPACPTVEQVKEYAWYCLNDRENNPKYVQKKLSFLSQAFRYFQNEPAFPHPTDFNPFEAAKHKLDLSPPPKKEPPRLTIAELRDMMGRVKHIRDRTIITTQLKLGLRGSELCNIKLAELHINHPEVLAHYDEMGGHQMLDGRRNAVYIPHDRQGNKSRRPRVLPLDDELRRLLIQYLLVRPDNEEPWVFLSKSKGYQMDDTIVNDRWKEYWHPEYAETERYEAVTSHFGRHFFTTFWTVKKDAPRELVKYMRGDVNSGGRNMKNSGDAIDSYIHTYYEDIVELYRRKIFKLGL
ncbi:tyrosine-type recombinase/integrase [Haladaptatus sp. NG-SE-30]